jgi:hypothetical protein
MVAAKLSGHREIGDGAIYRLCRELQREMFSAPDNTGWEIGQRDTSKLVANGRDRRTKRERSSRASA